MDNKKIRIACIMGTRPEVIKMAPIIAELSIQPQTDVSIISTAQHREMLDDMLRFFRLNTDVDLNVMRPNQTLSQLSSELFLRLEPVLVNGGYDVVLVQGDTTTALVA